MSFLLSLGIILLIVNAIANLFQFLRLRSERATPQEQNGVLAFVFINGLIAVLLGLSISWANYLALAFPLMGVLELSLNLRNLGGSKALSYLILAPDAALVTIFVYVLFFA